MSGRGRKKGLRTGVLTAEGMRCPLGGGRGGWKEVAASGLWWPFRMPVTVPLASFMWLTGLHPFSLDIVGGGLVLYRVAGNNQNRGVTGGMLPYLLASVAMGQLIPSSG